MGNDFRSNTLGIWCGLRRGKGSEKRREIKEDAETEKEGEEGSGEDRYQGR
jgi:hypothetical protein